MKETLVSADEINAGAKQPVVKMRVSDMFRRFADNLDKVGKLAGLADPGYATLQQIIRAMQVYSKTCFGVDIAPRNLGAAAIAQVPKAITEAKGGIGLG